LKLSSKHKTNSKQLFYKAGFSSLAGLPIAYLLNVSILPFFIPALQENTFIAGIFICIPFVIASVVRIFTIDYFYQRYGINLNPTHLFRKALHREILA